MASQRHAGCDSNPTHPASGRIPCPSRPTMCPCTPALLQRRSCRIPKPQGLRLLACEDIVTHPLSPHTHTHISRTPYTAPGFNTRGAVTHTSYFPDFPGSTTISSILGCSAVREKRGGAATENRVESQVSSPNFGKLDTPYAVPSAPMAAWPPFAALTWSPCMAPILDQSEKSK